VLRDYLKQQIDELERTINLFGKILAGLIKTINFILGLLAQFNMFDWVRSLISAIFEWENKLKIMYNDIKDIHYSRLKISIQQIHYLPKNPKEARSTIAIKEGWKKATENENWYHRNKDGINNVKYYNSKTGQEVVYEHDGDNGRIVISKENIGTYNHYSPDDWKKHLIYDVFPYWLWGNSEEDDTSFGNKIIGN